jgi:hypothetical protein
MSQNLRDKYNYYEMKGINMQDNRYVQQSNVDRLESELHMTREVYDKSMKYLSSAIEGAEIERIDRIQALRKLAITKDKISL